MNHAEAGKRGAAACMKKYGPEFFRINGQLGGRPRKPTLAELRQKRADEIEKIEKEAAVLADSKSLKAIVRALRLRQMSTAV